MPQPSKLKQRSTQPVSLNLANSSQGSPSSTPVALRFPLTKKLLEAAFSDLKPEGLELEKRRGYNEAQVHGAWSLWRLTRHMKALGLKPVKGAGQRDAPAFVNDENTIGVVLYGVRANPDPKKAAWLTYSVEVQARPLYVARQTRLRGPLNISNIIGI